MGSRVLVLFRAVPCSVCQDAVLRVGPLTKHTESRCPRCAAKLLTWPGGQYSWFDSLGKLQFSARVEDWLYDKER